MFNVQRTFVMIKPDGVQRGLVGELIGRLEGKGLKLVGLKMIQVSDELARKHYDVHRERPFFAGLIAFITSSPVVAMVWEGRKAVEVVRGLLGATDGAAAAPGSIRGDLALDVGMNLCHGSDGEETAAQEIALWFNESDLCSYHRDVDAWVVED
ncbi:MAG: nucleoside-diphosphate kinase [Thermaerobacterales bacterium]